MEACGERRGGESGAGEFGEAVAVETHFGQGSGGQGGLGGGIRSASCGRLGRDVPWESGLGVWCSLPLLRGV